MANSKPKQKPKTTTSNSNSISGMIEAISKELGSQPFVEMGGVIKPIPVFPTGVMSLDHALGIGGIPYGRIMEIYGPESGGKTTTTLAIAAACQRHFIPHRERHGVVAFVDAEHALDPTWAARNGVDVDPERFIWTQPDNGEHGFTILEKMAKSGLVDLAIVDSVAALLPKDMIDGEMGASSIGKHSQMMSKGIGKIKGDCNKNKMTVIFINQIRQKIGVMFGNPETTPGGLALKFYSSIRAEVRKISQGQLKDDDNDVVGMRTQLKIIKNKVAPPFRVAEYDIRFGGPDKLYGIDRMAALLSCAERAKVIQLSGSQYSFDGEKIGNGRAAAIAALRQNDKWAEKIECRTREVLFAFDAPLAIDDGDVDDEDMPDELRDTQ
jgi:recombination protein RecA